MRSQKGEAHPRSILSEDDVREIRELRRDYGMTYPALGQQFGIATTTVKDICRRRRWAHVDDRITQEFSSRYHLRQTCPRS